MPHKTKTGWKWANIKRKTKGELAKTVYGIWKKNGSKGDFSDFWHRKDNGENTNESKVLTPGETTLSVNGLKTINNSRTGSEHMNTKTNNATTLVESWGTPWQRITTMVINEYNVDDEEPDVFETEFGNPIDQVADDMEDEQAPRFDETTYNDKELQSYFGNYGVGQLDGYGAASKSAYQIDKMAVAINRRIITLLHRAGRARRQALWSLEDNWSDFGRAIESISDGFFHDYWDTELTRDEKDEFTADVNNDPESGNEPVKSNFGKQQITWYLDQIKSLLSMMRKEALQENEKMAEAVGVIISFFDRKLYRQTATIMSNFAFKMK